ncbi:MAG: hypothetical protein C5B52_07915 [Bacteroidetes bacterium]|nr:MAG: hypothetical protein C5B52_07915 [Bacteroidota bacterium]
MASPILSAFAAIRNHLTANGTHKSAKSILFVILKDLNYLLRSVWLFFPPILFLLVCYQVFWNLSQGQDVLVSVFEDRFTFIRFMLAHTLWVFMTWYTSRLLSYAKEKNNPVHLPQILFTHIPRILGFMCYTIVLLAFIRSTKSLTRQSSGYYSLLLWLSLFYYVFLNWLAGKIKTYSIRVLALSLPVILVILVTIGASNFYPWTIISVLAFMQVYFVFFVVGRRRIIEQKNAEHKEAKTEGLVARLANFFMVPPNERIVFVFFNICATIFLFFYILCFESLSFALWVRTCTLVFLAFSFLVGITNIISFFSVKYSISFHIILITLAFITGKVESYRVELGPKKNPSAQFSQRLDLKTYFDHWLGQRSNELNNAADNSYPVFLVMANGGASRSGYWVASVLSKLEDSTKGNFSHHLFCLSGASGGSLGNATFFSLLRYKDQLPKSDTANLEASKKYLQSDFLTFTLANMLGPDYFRHLYPINLFKTNRANALIRSIEEAPKDNVLLKDKLGDGFSEFVTKKGDTAYNLPILFINSTRMQDGAPSVISNILINSSIYNGRVDVLNLLDSNQEMKLSTAVELGASFPYVCPANRIDYTSPTGKVYSNYFVDGGYFDNSGAGVVHETILELLQVMNDTTNSNISRYKNKIQFYVVHILNDPFGSTPLNPVGSIRNDLAAPLITLAGSYGTQTSTNDRRLVKYLQLIYSSPNHYIPINLYRERDSVVFSMNWVISRKTLGNMDLRLNESDTLKKLIHFINASPK